MSNKTEEVDTNIVIECETCSASWKEDLLDYIDNVTKPALIKIYNFIKKKLDTMN